MSRQKCFQVKSVATLFYLTPVWHYHINLYNNAMIRFIVEKLRQEDAIATVAVSSVIFYLFDLFINKLVRTIQEEEMKDSSTKSSVPNSTARSIKTGTINSTPDARQTISTKTIPIDGKRSRDTSSTTTVTGLTFLPSAAVAAVGE